MAEYIPTIGLEIHTELKTRTKMFCDSLNDPDETHPNVNICPICLGHPGTLPVINKKAVLHVLKVGIALDAEIQETAKFDRKNYFYPDLPKGYQISQYDQPLCIGGFLDSNSKRIRIRRIHLEEDTGRNIHPEGADYSLVDFNRAGVPLMELVTEPDMHSAQEARLFAEELQLLFRYLGVSDADMEKGQMRLEANISVGLRQSEGLSGRTGSKKEPVLGTKVEVKNLNSFRALEDAIRYEIERQTGALESGKEISQETRGWDDNKKITYSQRWKEEAGDYRYFPEPDLPPLVLRDFDLERLKREIPELPREKQLRLQKEYGFSDKDSEVLVAEPAYCGFFEKAVSEIAAFDIGHAHAKQELVRLMFNYLTSDLRGLLVSKAASISDTRITPEHFAHLVYMIHKGEISSRGGKAALKKMFETGADPETVARDEGLSQVSDIDKLEHIINDVISANQKAVEDYRKGKLESLQFLVGQTMARSKGSANPKVVEEILKRVLAG